jgi:ribosomal protein S18 acetylase RimI-like enzyme
MMTLHFRQAVAADADQVVPLIYSSGPAAFDFVFTTLKRGRALDFLRSAFIQGDGEFGYRNHLVAVDDGVIVATGGGWSGANGFSFMLAAARQIVGHYGLLTGAGVIVRGLRTESVIPPPPRDRYYLGHLGVVPGRQGQGIGQQLIQHLLMLGTTQGFTATALHVSAANPRAQALYERIGFTVVQERPSTLRNAHGSVGLHRCMEARGNPFDVCDVPTSESVTPPVRHSA